MCISFGRSPKIMVFIALRYGLICIFPDRQRGFWTYILDCPRMWWNCKNPHMEDGFETHTYSRQLIVMLVCMFQKSCACGGFFKTAHPVEGFWVLSWYVCMCVMSLTGREIRDIWTIHRTPPHKSWKIELNVKYWKVFVRNRTSSQEHEYLPTYIPARQTYIPAQQTYQLSKHTYMLGEHTRC